MVRDRAGWLSPPSPSVCTDPGGEGTGGDRRGRGTGLPAAHRGHPVTSDCRHCFRQSWEQRGGKLSVDSLGLQCAAQVT
jgi:hypothetical protein